MNDHRKNPHYIRGLLLVLITTTLWGVLPIFLKIAVRDVPAGSIAWFRFTFAFFVLYFFLSVRGDRPGAILRSPPWQGIVAGVALAGNYYGVTQAVHFSGPSNVAILIQIAPVLLVVVGVLFFREALSPLQMLGFAIAAAGFFVFYHDQTGNTTDLALYSSATGLLISAAVAWVVYMTCQKILSRDFAAQSLNLLVYGVAALVLIPQVDWQQFATLGTATWGLLCFLGFNTLIAYGALAEAVKLIPLTTISILVALNPLITLLGMEIVPRLGPGWLAPESIGFWGYAGAMTAVGGVVLAVFRPPRGN